MAITVEYSKISKGNQVVIPAKIRSRFGLKADDLVVWAVIGNEVLVKFLRREEGSLSKLIGGIDMGPTSPEEVDEIVTA